MAPVRYCDRHLPTVTAATPAIFATSLVVRSDSNARMANSFTSSATGGLRRTTLRAGSALPVSVAGVVDFDLVRLFHRAMFASLSLGDGRAKRAGV